MLPYINAANAKDRADQSELDPPPCLERKEREEVEAYLSSMGIPGAIAGATAVEALKPGACWPAF